MESKEKHANHSKLALSDPPDCCSAPKNKLSGEVIFVHRGNCKFTTKANVAQQAGASAILIINYRKDFRFNIRGYIYLVITPKHDYYALTPHAQEQIPRFLRKWITPYEPPDNHVVLTVGALHKADAATACHDELAPLPKPLVVVKSTVSENFLGTSKTSSFHNFFFGQSTPAFRNNSAKLVAV